MTPEAADEARALIASARACLAELHEEGLEHFDALEREEPRVLPTPETPAPPAASPRAASAPVAQPATTPAPSSPPLTRTPPPTPAAAIPEATEVPWADAPTLDEVREFLGDCTRCGLHKGRNQIVFGDGNLDADLMFVGEGPGEQEDRRGLPFVGRAGELLTQMIEKGLGIERSSVYICNIVKCRPPSNRTPLPDEVARCRAFLDGQIAAVKPRVIVTLGKPAASLLLGRDVAITRIRGTWQEYKGIPLMPTLHPAYILRQYTEQNRRLVWEDLKAAQTKSTEG